LERKTRKEKGKETKKKEEKENSEQASEAICLQLAVSDGSVNRWTCTALK
jgi:hypothetical protein